MSTSTGAVTARLLDVWELGATRPVTGRALALLTAARPEASPAELAALSIGRRDALLLELRTRVFGDRVVGLAGCTSCGELLEVEFSGSDITIAEPPPGPAEGCVLRAEPYEVRVRLLDSRDLAGIAHESAVPAARDALLRGCVLSASLDGREVPTSQLPDGVMDLVEQWLAAADPQADIRISLRCPACATAWQQSFDIVSFLWAEIDALARRTLYDVHRLATAYGWRESDILAMSEPRRRVYLELVET
ncbi:hypothetical protein OG897_28455 [Streptomyces sp. NBC_00237]|uniref:hypothetical protein n=1 Tax=Streptomyces sp. NBC_00237 TaxID=2975687 RepID=UPI002259479C|nr:hypothetical protein [Streptomyces sp. NBC_00237]MCX5205378.1 hypothetical protein [Streptomyces sp. NBC_00237]